jgi:hypothetical protein
MKEKRKELAPCSKRGGAPFGNQNARKHGYYSKALSDSEQRDFRPASRVSGIDDEIALLRVRIKSLVQNDPHNLKLMMRLMNSLGRLLKIRYTILQPADKSGASDVIADMFKDVVLPVGTLRLGAPSSTGTWGVKRGADPSPNLSVPLCPPLQGGPQGVSVNGEGLGVRSETQPHTTTGQHKQPALEK